MHASVSLGLVFSFLIGSIPFGWVVAKLWGIDDLRKVGSTNIGATNVVRTAGVLPGAVTFGLDFLKGLAPTLYFARSYPESHFIWFGVAAVLGHCFSPFMSLRGGKGVSTTLGVAIAYNPLIGISSVVVYGLALLLTKTSALGSLYAMLSLIAGASLFVSSTADNIGFIFIVLVVLVRHKDNWNALLLKAMAIAICFGLAPQLSSFARASSELTIDYRGKSIISQTQPKRVVALVPSLAETVVDLGAKDRLVGAPDYSKLPASISKSVQSLGPYNRISAEVVSSLKPDLVLASIDGYDLSLVLKLEKLGIKVVTVNTQSLSDIVRSYEIAAAALGVKDRSVVEQMKKSLLATDKPAPKSDVFVQVGWQPLVSVSERTFIDELLRLAGGKNIFSDAPMKYPRPNPEEVIARNPSVIIICKLTDSGKEAEDAKNFWMKFKNIRAVKKNRVFIVPGNWLTKPGLELIHGLQEIKKII